MGSVMRRVSVRNLLAHKVRLLLTLVSVVLGTAFVAGSFVFTDTLKSSFDKIFADAYKGISTHVQPKHAYDAGVPFGLVDTITKVDGVKAVVPNVTEPIVLVTSHGTKVKSGGAPSEAGMWVDPASSITKPPTFDSGRAPARSGEVAINTGAAKNGGLHVGDHVRIILPNVTAVPLTISGVYATDAQTGGYVGALLSRDQAIKLLTDGSHYSSVDVAAQAGVSQQQLTARIAQVLPSTLKAETGDQLRDDQNKQIVNALSFINYVLLAFGFIALVVGTFIIYNTFSMIVAQRLRELALLRAVGASRKQVRRSVLLEAGLIGAVGSVIGIVGGIGLAYLLKAVLDALNVGLPSGALVLGVRTIVIAVVVGVGVTLLSAYAPARRASSIPPVAAMREEFATPAAASIRRRSILGAVLAAAGAAITALGGVSKSTGSGASLLGLGLVTVGAGALLLSPLLANLIITPLGRVVGRPFGRVGTLARTNAVRNPRRTAATAFALTLGLLIVSGIAVLGASMKSSINQLFDNNVTADYILTTAVEVPVPIPAAAAAARVDGVQSLTQLHGMLALVDGHVDYGTGVDGPLNGALSVTYQAGSGEPTGQRLLASEKVVTKYGWRLGSTHVLAVPGRATERVTLAGIYKDSTLLGPWMVSGEVYRTLTPPQEWGDMVALVNADPGADLATLRAGLEKATEPYYIVNVDNRTEFKGQIASQINGLLGLLYGLLGLAIVIAILGIINTLALSVVERRREIGMLRAVGMVRKQVRRVIYLESLLIAVFGAGLGLVLGLTYGVLFTHLLRDSGLDVLTVPWGQALAFLVLAGVVGVLAALWPGIRAARTPPLAAIVET
jgi:putative ABC transport system permease protein